MKLAETGRAGASGRVWQRMLSGRRLDLLDPSPLDIEIADIAHGLARVARWNGQTRGPHIFSVAQHSLLVEALCGECEPAMAAPDRLAALLHDAPEYVIGDLISPFKSILGDTYKVVEKRLLAAIHLRFSLPPTTSVRVERQIKRADRTAALMEAVLLADFSRTEAERLFGRHAIHWPKFEGLLAPLACEAAETGFLQRFFDLQQG
jgi:5'-deoxynucleotidase YfbR-like HD superfamily hydrolase